MTPPRTALTGLLRRCFGPGLLIALVLATAAPAASSGAERNWSPAIAAARRTQLAYESVMRSADAQIRRLTHAARRAKRARARSHATLLRARQRRGEQRSDLADARDRLARARERLALLTAASPELVDVLAGAIGSAANPFAAAEVASLTALDEGGSSAEDASTLVARQPLGPMSLAAAPRSTGMDLAALASEARTYSALLLAAQRSVDALAAQVRGEARSARRAEHRWRRAQHRQRTRVRAVAAIARARRGAVARRESAEAVLGNAILGMSRLAQHRVANKTDARPGLNANFAWPTRGRLTQRYGCTGFAWEPALGSCRHFHDGIDIAGYQGTPIRAAAVGVISYIGWNPWDEGRRAFMIVVAHPGGFETLYGHAMPTRAVRVGQLVRKGQVIGYMGSTGRATGVHLHLEMRRGRQTLNPLAYL